jgi:hypothetical protein
MATEGYVGFQEPASAASHVNAMRLMIDSILARVRTATLVKVVAVTNSGAAAAVGFVDILPLVKQVDAGGNATKHKTIFKCPYLRIQGGANAIILDPQVGDIGIAVFSDRDISTATATKAEAAPGSRRKFSMADGLYLGGVLNGTPTQFVRFSTTGIEIHSPTQVNLTAPDVKIDAATVEINASTSATVTTPTFTVNGATQLNGAVNASSTVVAGTSVTAPNVVGTTDVSFGGKAAGTHTHDHGTMTASGHTGAPL